MKKLGKKLTVKKDTLQAYMCDCFNACSSVCRPSGPPDWAPQVNLIVNGQA
jgi:putative bacteriocin precursor